MAYSSDQLPILIIGGGIGGLCLALRLAKSNIACVVLEQSVEFSEIGAGLQLSPNAVKRLKTLGLDIQVGLAATCPTKITIRDAIKNNVLNEVPLGASVIERYGAPYWVVARKDLQSILLNELARYDCVELMLGQKFVNYQQDARKVTALMEGGDEFVGRLLVGADGIWSRVRHMISKEAHPSVTGMVAWRALVEADGCPPLFTRPETTVWLGPDAHLVHYRVQTGEKVNLVAVTKGAALQRSWSETVPNEQLFEQIRAWHKEVRSSVMEIKGWTAWPLMLLRPFRPWYKRRLVLLGDAAHAVVPFLAQGAAMAIEDAVLMGDLLEQHNKTPEIVPPLFEQQRFNRCRRVSSKSIYNLQLYHAHSIYRHIRNFGLGLMPGKLLLRQYDWLYKG